jgi:hypothetical protein
MVRVDRETLELLRKLKGFYELTTGYRWSYNAALKDLLARTLKFAEEAQVVFIPLEKLKGEVKSKSPKRKLGL